MKSIEIPTHEMNLESLLDAVRNAGTTAVRRTTAAQSHLNLAKSLLHALSAELENAGVAPDGPVANLFTALGQAVNAAQEALQ